MEKNEYLEYIGQRITINTIPSSGLVKLEGTLIQETENEINAPSNIPFGCNLNDSFRFDISHIIR